MDDSESPSPLEETSPPRRGTDHSRRTHRSSKDRDRLFMGGSSRELTRLLIYQERDAKDLRQMLSNTAEHVKAETQRADAAEERARDVVFRLKAANDAKAQAEQDTARVNEELRLYKLQLENAQREIHRAQELLDTVEAQRLEAEEAAARARSTARKLKEEKVVQMAREEGRRRGMEEGIEHGRRLGFEEGRAEGYARGRAAAMRSRTYVDRMEPLEDDRPSESSSSPRAYRQNRRTDYTPPRASPPEDSPVQIPTPRAPPIVVPGPLQDQPLRPIPVRTVLSPSHPPVDIPPDGWIPEKSVDDRIRLPPPHELARPPPISPSPPPSITLQNAMEAVHDKPMMIPPPSRDHGDSDSDSPDTPSAPQRPRHRRRRSNESQSTTMSQFELLGPPITFTPAPRSSARDRQPALNTIAEERERSSSISSPASGVGGIGSPYAQSSSNSFYLRPSPQVAPSNMSGPQDFAPNQNIYVRPRTSNSSLASSARLAAPIPMLRPPSQQSRSPRDSTSSNEGITFQVIPPSRPESHNSKVDSLSPHGDFLSAHDADRPLPPTEETPNPEAQTPVIPSLSPANQPIVLPDGQLPPGFVASGPPVNMNPYPSPHPPSGNTNLYTNPTSPAGVPLPPSVYSGTPSVVSGAVPAGFVPEKVVIPNLPSSGSALGPPTGVYTRSNLRDSSSESDDAVDSRISDDSLTTPPPSRHKKMPSHGTPAYPVAPIPSNVTYPAPPTPRSLGSHTTTAARVPLPPSVAGSASPRSTVGYLYSRTPYSRSNLGLDGSRSPGAQHMPMSPIMGSARGEAAPLPPMPFATPGRQSEPLAPEYDDVRANTAANAMSARPPSAAARSPSASYLSLAPTNATSKSKKSKKGKKSKSRADDD